MCTTYVPTLDVLYLQYFAVVKMIHINIRRLGSGIRTLPVLGALPILSVGMQWRYHSESFTVHLQIHTDSII